MRSHSTQTVQVVTTYRLKVPLLPAPVPEKPREQTEKERMAAALFGGVASGSAGAKRGISSRRRQRRYRRYANNSSNEANNMPSSSPSTDLLGVDSPSRCWSQPDQPPVPPTPAHGSL